MGGRHQLAMFAKKSAVGSKEERGAVQGAAVALDDADHEMNVVFPRRFAESFRGRSGDLDGTRPVAAELFAALRRTAAHPRAEIQALWINGNKRLGKDRQGNAFARRFRRQPAGLFDTGLRIEWNRAGLNYRSSKLLHDSLPH